MDSVVSALIGVVAGFAIMYIPRWVEGKIEERKKHRLGIALGADSSPDHMQSKTFTVRDALNGQYITFHKHKYNPNGPDINEQCVYIVRDGDTLIDAISVVLVLMDKED
jgi:hypothetical protein